MADTERTNINPHKSRPRTHTGENHALPTSYYYLPPLLLQLILDHIHTATQSLEFYSVLSPIWTKILLNIWGEFNYNTRWGHYPFWPADVAVPKGSTMISAKHFQLICWFNFQCINIPRSCTHNYATHCQTNSEPCYLTDCLFCDPFPALLLLLFLLLDCHLAWLYCSCSFCDYHDLSFTVSSKSEL